MAASACATCGARLDPSAARCGVCWTPSRAPLSVSAPPLPTRPPRPRDDANDAPDGDSAMPVGSDKTGMTVVFVLLSLAAVLVVGGIGVVAVVPLVRRESAHTSAPATEKVQDGRDEPAADPPREAVPVGVPTPPRPTAVVTPPTRADPAPAPVPPPTPVPAPAVVPAPVELPPVRPAVLFQGPPPAVAVFAPPLVTQLDRFQAAVALKGRRELLTFSARTVPGGRLAGLVRRYRLPDFALLGSARLPVAVVGAAVDEAAGRLVVTTATRPDPVGLGDGTARGVTAGEVQVYDLARLLEPGAPAEVRPVAVVALPAGRPVGVEVGPDGAAYTATLAGVGPPGGRKAWKSKLFRLDLGSGKVTAELDLADPVWQIKLTPDGTRLFAAGQTFTPTGTPNFGSGQPTRVLVVDVAGWQTADPITFPGPAVDLTTAADGRLLAAVAVGGAVRLFATTGGPPVDVTPFDWRLPLAGSVAVTPNGNTVVAAARGEPGVEVLAAGPDRAGGLTPRARATVAGGVAVGGHFVLTPDGRYAVFQAGPVLDIEMRP